MQIRLAAIFAVIATPVLALAQTWTLSTADLAATPVTLVGIADAGVTVSPPDGGPGRVIPFDQFVQLDRSAAPVDKASKFVLYLSGGDRAGGEPVRMDGDNLVFNSAAAGELTIPLSRLVALAKPSASVDLSSPRTEDVVALANGDVVRGIISGGSETEFQVKAGGDDALGVPFDAINTVYFAATGAAATAPERGFRLRLNDGSVLTGPKLTATADGFSLQFGEGAAVAVAPAAVIGIEQVNGPVSWLAARTPAEEVYVPFLSAIDPASTLTWKMQIDTDVAGQRFVVQGREFRRGIGVHSYSRITYALDGAYKFFRTRYGINDGLLRGDVTVRILLDGQPVHTADHVRPGVLSAPIEIELKNAKQLTLEVDYGDGIDVEDRLNWLEPALLKGKPAAEKKPAVNAKTAE